MKKASSATVDQSHRDDVLRARGIANNIIDYIGPDGRPRYATVTTYEELKKYHSHPSRGFHGRLIAQSRALVINRWDVKGDPLPSYLRFDEKVVTNPCTPHDTTRYVYPSSKQVGPHRVKVMDVHPVAVPLLTASPTPPIYFCIEGCLKADALLSFGRAAISVPSVTLWRTSRTHLRQYLPFLRAAESVFVVPDSDYLLKPIERGTGKPVLINPNVRSQTDKAVAWLRGYNVESAYLVPPFLDPQAAKAAGVIGGDRWKIGIDDHLARGGNLQSLSALNPAGVHRWKPYMPMSLELPVLSRKRRDRAVDRDTTAAKWLYFNHGNEGLFSPGDMTDALKWDRKTTWRALDSLQSRSVIRVWQGARVWLADEKRWVNDPHLFVFVLRAPPQEIAV